MSRYTVTGTVESIEWTPEGRAWASQLPTAEQPTDRACPHGYMLCHACLDELRRDVIAHYSHGMSVRLGATRCTMTLDIPPLPAALRQRIEEMTARLGGGT